MIVYIVVFSLVTFFIEAKVSAGKQGSGNPSISLAEHNYLQIGSLASDLQSLERLWNHQVFTFTLYIDYGASWSFFTRFLFLSFTYVFFGCMKDND